MAIDLTNQRFGRLLVLYKTDKRSGHNIVWHCKCDCGNEKDIDGGSLRQGKTKSCGCLQKEKASKTGQQYKDNLIYNTRKDITDQYFGRLKALEYNEKLKKWKCQCDCGNIAYVRLNDLESGNTKSCGCLKKETTAELGRSMLEDLTGQKFGRLIVLKDTKERLNNQPIWLCQCECGSLHKVASSNLKQGNVQSCGCLISKGEEIISRILSENNITFEKQKEFQTCKFSDTKKSAKFDFFVNNQYLIEFDGIQHFIADKGWNTEEKLLQTQKRDNFKNQWCKENNIPLIRIPYTQLPILKLEDLLLETTSFIKE